MSKKRHIDAVPVGRIVPFCVLESGNGFPLPPEGFFQKRVQIREKSPLV
jgi:hypothetical protein